MTLSLAYPHARALLLALIMTGAHAQNQKDRPLPLLPGPDSLSLRWNLPSSTLPDGGFKLYRSSGGTETILRVSAPADKATVLKNGWLNEKQYETFKNIFAGAKTDQERFRNAMLEVQTLIDPNLARALGILYTDSGLKAGTRYSYRVVALVGGRELELGRAEGTPGTPPPVLVPSNLAPKLSPGKVQLTWENLVVRGGLVTAYKVYRSEGASKAVLLEPNPIFPSLKDAAGMATDPTFTDTTKDLKTNTVYRYQVSSLDIFGRESALSNPVTVDTSLAVPLAVPLLSKVASGDKSVELSWKKVDPRATGVVVLRSSTFDGKLEPLTTLAGNATSYSDKSVVPGKTYAYALMLKTEAGTSSAPGPAQGVRAVNKTAPSTPSSLTVTSKEDQLELSWKGGGESDLMGYYVLRAERKDASVSDYVFLEPDPIAKLSYTDKVPAGVQRKFFYRVIAVNTSNVRSNPTDAVQASLIDQTPPPAPTLLEVSGLDGAIGLRFSTPRAQDLKQLEIFRADPQGKTVLVKAIAPDTLAFVDRSVVPNVTYAYALTAVDTSGNRSEVSNYITARAFQTGAPDAPRGLKATSSKDGVALEWDALPTGVFAVIYRLDGTRLVQITEALEGTRFVVSGAKVGQTFALRAINLSGTLSEASEKVTVR